MDSDSAGQKAVRRAGEILQQTGLEVRVVLLPDGKDPDEYIKKNGAARFKALLEGAVSEIEYKLLTAIDGIDVNTDDGKLQYLMRAAEIVAAANDVMTRDLYIGRLSDKYGVSRTALQDKVNQLRKRNYKMREKRELEEITKPKFDKNDVNPEKRYHVAAANAEEAVISVLMQHPDFFTTAQEQLPPEKMVTTINRRIYKHLCDCIACGRNPDLSYFGEILTGSEMGYLASLANSERGDKNAHAVLKDSIKVILDEGILKNTGDVKNMSADDWADSLQKIIDAKKKGN